MARLPLSTQPRTNRTIDSLVERCFIGKLSDVVVCMQLNSSSATLKLQGLADKKHRGPYTQQRVVAHGSAQGCDQAMHPLLIPGSDYVSECFAPCSDFVR
jgi:hypothetical protein